MNEQERKAMKLALEALESYKDFIDDANIIEGQWLWIDGADNAQTALREALAQPEQEPVAWMTQARNFVHLLEFTEAQAKLYGWKAVYTNPPQRTEQEPVEWLTEERYAQLHTPQRPWVDLTDEELFKWWCVSEEADATEAEIDFADCLIIARAVLAKSKEKNI